MNFTSRISFLRKLVLCIFIISWSFLAPICVEIWAKESSNIFDNVNEVIRFEKIVVTGNNRVAAEAIIAPFKNEQQSLTPAYIDECVKKLYSKGLFEDIKVLYNHKAKILTIKVKENRIINSIEIVGNDFIGSSKIKDLMKMKRLSPFSEKDLFVDTNSIFNSYLNLGFYNVLVHPVVKTLPSGIVDVVFNVYENKKVSISKINFINNKSFSSRKLSSILLSAETGLLNYLLSADSYNPYKVEVDKEFLRLHYINAGYLDFKVSDVVVEVSPRTGFAVITFYVDEGKRYVVRDITFNGIDEKYTRKLKKKIKSNVYLDLNVIKKHISVLKYLIDKEEGEGAHIDFDINKVGDTTVDVSIVRNALPKSYIGSISINGNNKTGDRVVQKYINLNEGDFYFGNDSISQIRASIMGTGFFENVNITPYNSGDKVNLNIDLVEKEKSVEVDLNVGYDNLNGPFFYTSYNDGNLKGSGHLLSFGMSKRYESDSLFLSILNPYFLDRNMKFAVELEHSAFYENKLGKGKISEYEINGLGFRLVYPITEKFDIGWSYSTKNKSIGPNNSNFHELDRRQMKKQLFSTIGVGLEYKNVYKYDEDFNPLNTLHISFSSDFAGVGVTEANAFKYIENSAFLSYKHTLYPKWIYTFRSRLNYFWYYGDKYVGPLGYYHNAVMWMRGFESKGVGPRSMVDDKISLPSKAYYAITNEITYQINKNNVLKPSIFGFFDIGDMYGIAAPASAFTKNGKKGFIDESKIYGIQSGNVRLSGGVGISITMPLLGVISFYCSLFVSGADFDAPLAGGFGISVGNRV